MLAVFIGVGIRLWMANSDPDNDVHNAAMASPDIGEFFMNTTTGQLFLCYRNVVSDQLWQSSTNEALIQSMIDAIPQADWLQSNTAASDYIKNKPSIPDAQVQSDWTQANASSVDYIKNKPPIPSAQIQSDWTQSNSALLDYIKNKPSIPAAQIQSDWTQASSGALDFIKNKPPARSQSSATRALNTAFQVSATRDSIVNYSVNIATSLTLSGGAVGVVYLEIATDAAFTNNVQELGRFENGNTGALTIGLSLAQNVTSQLSGYVPLGFYCRLRTASTTGSPTFTYRSGQEVLV